MSADRRCATTSSADEDPAYIAATASLSYVPAQAFTGKRLLDFGCGAAASSVVVARLLPDVEIVGVDLDEDLLEAARLRAALQCMPLRLRRR
jgi:cyclopropane fatty-acyl-phospholipid synthase-like methyltransferase